MFCWNKIGANSINIHCLNDQLCLSEGYEYRFLNNLGVTQSCVTTNSYFLKYLQLFPGLFYEGQGHVDSPQPCPFMSIICESKTRDGMTGAISGVSAVLCLVIKSVLQPVTPTLPRLHCSLLFGNVE